MDSDPDLDIIGFYTPINWLSQLERHGASGYMAAIARSLGRVTKKMDKLFFVICPIVEMTEFNAKVSLTFKEALWKKFVPHFESIARATTALSHVVNYSRYGKKSI